MKEIKIFSFETLNLILIILIYKKSYIYIGEYSCIKPFYNNYYKLYI